MSDQPSLTSKQAVFLEALADHLGNISKTCEAIGIVRQTYYNWLNDSPTFKEAVDNMHESFLDSAEGVIKRAMFEKDNLIAAMFYLKCQGKQRGWMERTEIQKQVNHTVEIQIPEFLKKQLEGKPKPQTIDITPQPDSLNEAVDKDSME
jgi:hypothetical protein